MTKNIACPNCNCSGDTWIFDIHPETLKGRKGYKFCYECYMFVKLVPLGTLWKEKRKIKELRNGHSNK